MNYSIPENDVFLEKVQQIFSKYLEGYGYSITSTKNEKMHCKIIYSTDSRRVEIINQYNYTDYGFSIFIYNTKTNRHNLLANVPFHKEDKKCVFIEETATALLRNHIVESMLSGQTWEDLEKIIYTVKDDR
ncbi:MAG: hypothetical protein U0Z26_04985 [Anaerolineales bacterium]